jgi:cytochrome c-type biogenesis protein CcmH
VTSSRLSLGRVVALLLAGVSATALGAEGFETQTIQLTPEQEARAMHLGKQIRCAVCQGMSAADSPAEMAHAMMSRVRELVAQGKSDDEILDHFAARYGEWVLLEPKPKNNFAVWMLPVLLLLGGVVLIAYMVRSRASPPADASGPPAKESGTPPPSGDSYRDEIRAEVDH